MHGSSYYSLLGIFLFWLFISWLLYRLLGWLHPLYKNRPVGYVYWALTFIGIGVYFMTRRTGGLFDPIESLSHGLFIWLVWQMGMLILLLSIYFLNLVFRLLRAPRAIPDPSRRQFLKHGAAALPILAFGFTGDVFYTSGHRLDVQRMELSFSDLPAAARGMKIVQISDTHIGAFVNLDRFTQIIEIIQQERPDILVITGDLIDDLTLLKAAVTQLTKLHPTIPQGIYFCWGNHEYFRDHARIEAALKNSPITVLRNEGKKIFEDAQHPFYLLGVDYPWARSLQEQEPIRRRMIDQTLDGIPPNAFKVLLTHHPNFITEAFARNISLTLAGHTHGGQVAVGGYTISPVQYQYMSGLYRSNSQVAYVNNGAGHWFPLRFGRPAEIAVITLVSDGVH